MTLLTQDGRQRILDHTNRGKAADERQLATPDRTPVPLRPELATEPTVLVEERTKKRRRDAVEDQPFETAQTNSDEGRRKKNEKRSSKKHRSPEEKEARRARRAKSGQASKEPASKKHKSRDDRRSKSDRKRKTDAANDAEVLQSIEVGLDSLVHSVGKSRDIAIQVNDEEAVLHAPSTPKPSTQRSRYDYFDTPDAIGLPEVNHSKDAKSSVLPRPEMSVTRDSPSRPPANPGVEDMVAARRPLLRLAGGEKSGRVTKRDRGGIEKAARVFKDRYKKGSKSAEKGSTIGGIVQQLKAASQVQGVNGKSAKPFIRSLESRTRPWQASTLNEVGVS